MVGWGWGLCLLSDGHLQWLVHDLGRGLQWLVHDLGRTWGKLMVVDDDW